MAATARSSKTLAEDTPSCYNYSNPIMGQRLGRQHSKYPFTSKSQKTAHIFTFVIQAFSYFSKLPRQSPLYVLTRWRCIPSHLSRISSSSAVAFVFLEN
ncbi:hypothetical protein EJB05_19630 [Eragrostis curvula]|uniref:Uncharacterized protein n=1 Tax=Eragrostis curvula TaxID=38414 RepID=A0A5J9UXW2_9POAL|nr:hypothetical protein EJB05_19630 [Eragrostis curvula]